MSPFRTEGDSRLECVTLWLSPTYLQWGVGLGVDDYQKK